MHNKGFTLIEVMVALMILSIVAITTTKVSSGYLKTVDGMRTRTLAHFVAQNAAADISINKEWISAKKEKKVTEQGKKWKITYTPKKLNSLQNKNIQVININVSEVIGSSKTGTGSDINIVISKTEE